MKFDRRSTGSKQRPHEKSQFNPKIFNIHTRKEVERDTGWHRSAGLRNGQRGKCSDAWDVHVCKWNAHDDMIWNATHKQMTWQRRRITGRQRAQRSRGVTTLHHYERISSRDLGWHQRENGREREEVKTKLLLWQTSETKEPWEVEKKSRKEYNEGEQSLKHFVSKEGQRTLRKTLRLKGKIYIETTPVKKG